MTRKFTFLLMALLALAGFKSWGQETLTVYENGTANGEIPLNTGWIDAQGTISQCIIPASELGAMTGGTISQMQFYIYQAGQYGSIQDAVLECSLGEVATTTITSAITTGLTTVWSGNLNFSETNLTVTFTTPYQYNGGNLVISFYVVTSSSYTNYTFCGTTTDYQSCFSNHWISTYTFLPKTTFTYTGGSSCIAPTGLAASNVTANGATISWNDNGAESYNLDVNGTVNENVTNPYILDVELSTTYTVKVQAVCGEDETSAWSSAINFTTPNCWDGHTINYTLNDSYCDGWNGAYLTIVDSDDHIIETLNCNSGCSISGSLTLCSDTYDFVWHKGSYDSECSFSISENGETLFTCNNASYYTDGQVVYTLDLLEKFSITLTHPETVGTISADYEQAAAGTTVTLSANFNLGYTLNYFMVDGVQIVGNTFEMPEHSVTVSVAYNTLTMYDITSAVVTGGTVHAEYDNVTITEAPEGTVITLVAEAAEDYIFEYFTVDGVQIPGNTYTMGTSAIEIGASFRAVQTYAIHYYVNGKLQKTLHPKENAFISIVEPSSTVIPAGTTFAGWSREDITTYQTTEPVFVGNTEHPTEDCSLYAVLSYSEMGGATAWTKVTDFSELQNGDKVVIAAMDGENTGYTLNESCEFTGSATCLALPATFGNSGATIAALPEGTTQFTVGLNPNLADYLSLTGENGDLVYWDYNLNVPAGAEPETTNNLFMFDDSKLVAGYNEDWDELYVILHNYDSYGGTNMRFGVEQIQPGYYDAAYLYKQQGALATYYMTEVFVIAEATSLTEDMTKRNVIIADGASLNINANVTLNVAGACFNPSHDAAQLVIAEGGQLIHNNAGTVATMKKNITGTEWYTISSPLANSVGFTEVENLIPTTVETNNYDLYRLNEATGMWENSRIENQALNEFTTIDKGLGYIYANNAGADHIAFAGKVNVADVENVNLTKTADKGKGFNLIGNPFAQNIELANVTGVTLADGFYVLSNDGDWRAKITDRDIKPLQGFLVQATEEGGTARISKNASVRGERSNEQNTNIEMIVSNSNHRDNAFAMFGEGIGLNKVNHRNAEAPMLYIPQGGEDFAIAFMNENTTLFPLNFKAMTTGKYSISLKATDDINTLVLVDNMTGVETNMLLESSYSFIGSPADKENRFTVKLSISHSNGQSDNEHFVYQNGKELVVNGEGSLQIFDVLGRVVISEEVHGQTVYVGNLSEGAYIVRMTGNEVKTQKIIIR